jgi:hypothetical protein
VKRRVAFLIVFCLMFSIVSLPSHALHQENNPEWVIKPMFTYIDFFQSYFCITSTGRAEMDAFVYSTRNIDQAGVKICLQQKKNGVWTTIKSWSKIEDGTSCGLGKVWYVDKGHLYRLVAYGYVYIDGVMVESTYTTSKTHDY